MLVSIGICTLHRQSLARTLASIEQQDLPAHVSIEVVVIDNDRGGSAKPIVADFAAEVPFGVRYSIEPRRGLSNARNQVLSLAQGDWIALIDDDEIAKANWLSALVSCAQRFRAQGVVGRVCPKYEIAGGIARIDDSGVFDLQLPATGTRIGANDALSGNALLDARFLRAHSLKFDEAFNSTGGEDVDFFARLIGCGGLVVSSRDAVVQEIIGADRMTHEYLLRRSLRMGEIYARVAGRKGFARVRELARASLYACAAAALLVLHLPFGRSAYYRYRFALARNIGKLRFYSGMPPIEMYADVFDNKEKGLHANG